MSPDNMKPANAIASGTGSASQEEPYPPYTVVFIGGGLAPGGLTVSGPHTFALPEGAAKMNVSLDRNPPDGGKPNLKITFG